MPSPTIDWISIRGFKSLACVNPRRLRQINILIGPNGSGKSNFIEVFTFLNILRNRGLRTYVRSWGGADNLLHFGPKTTDQITIELSFEEELYQYRIRISPDHSDNLFVVSEVIQIWGETGNGKPHNVFLGNVDGEAEIGSYYGTSKQARLVSDQLDKLRSYHFHDTGWSSPMNKTATISDDHLLHIDGSNLAAVLYRLQTAYQQTFVDILTAVRIVAPFFGEFVLRPEELNKNTIRLKWKHQGSNAQFEISSLSDGTLRFIAIATLLLLPEALRPPIIIIDEPELGLHPVAINLLAELVKIASLETQIILATQSPALLDYFEPEDVLVADRKHGATTISRLDSEELEEWLEDYSLGQLWENNEFGGRPIPESVQ